jgi:hypothetical protein
MTVENVSAALVYARREAVLHRVHNLRAPPTP